MKILSIVGSMRKGSFSKKLATAAAKHAPEDFAFDQTDTRDVPLYDQELDVETKPAGVARLIEQIENSDALLFVLPEYNHGIPGPLKNAIDWASRPAFRSPLPDKPSLVIACSMSPAGGALAHDHLLTVLHGTLTPVFLMPSFLVPSVHEEFDDEGMLKDELTTMRLVRTLADFGDWAKSLDPA